MKTVLLGKKKIYAKNYDESLTEEELRQLNSEAGYVTGKEAKCEFGLQVDLP